MIDSAPAAQKAKEKRGVQSIEVGWRLIDALAAARTNLTLSDLAERADMTASRAYTYLVSLIRVGLVEQDEASGRYDLGEAALQLGISALTRTDIMEASRKTMSACRDQLGATTFLSLFGNMGPAIVYWLQGSYPVTVQVQAGSVLPILGSATGHVFLTYEEDEALIPHLEREIGNYDKSDKALAARIDGIRKSVRKNGLAVTKGGLISEVFGISAPIFDHQNHLRAVVTAIGSRDSFDISLQGNNAKILRKLAADVSKRVGAPGKSPD